jgi:hypothetical protein
MKTVDTYYARIYVGMREEYSDKVHNIEEVYELCQDYCNSIGLCVTVTPTKFIYKNGEEDGVIIGLINYPRFPAMNEEIQNTAYDIAIKFLKSFNQLKVSVEFPEKTCMVERESA